MKLYTNDPNDKYFLKNLHPMCRCVIVYKTYNVYTTPNRLIILLYQAMPTEYDIDGFNLN